MPADFAILYGGFCIGIFATIALAFILWSFEKP